MINLKGSAWPIFLQHWLLRYKADWVATDTIIPIRQGGYLILDSKYHDCYCWSHLTLVLSLPGLKDGYKTFSLPFFFSYLATYHHTFLHCKFLPGHQKNVGVTIPRLLPQQNYGPPGPGLFDSLKHICSLYSHKF